jgi:hypothetical protein
MHLLGGALENPPATTCKKGIPDEHEIGAAIGDVAGGMARDVHDFEVETEVRKRD